MRAAVLEVNLEGSIGGEMDTTPLFQALHGWGVKIDAFTNVNNNHTDRLEDRLIRPLSYVDNYYRNTPVDIIIKNTSYDIVILAPGSQVSNVDHCIGSAKMVRDL